MEAGEYTPSFSSTLDTQQKGHEMCKQAGSKDAHKYIQHGRTHARVGLEEGGRPLRLGARAMPAGHTDIQYASESPCMRKKELCSTYDATATLGSNMQGSPPPKEFPTSPEELAKLGEKARPDSRAYGMEKWVLQGGKPA